MKFLIMVFEFFAFKFYHKMVDIRCQFLRWLGHIKQYIFGYILIYIVLFFCNLWWRISLWFYWRNLLNSNSETFSFVPFSLSRYIYIHVCICFFSKVILCLPCISCFFILLHLFLVTCWDTTCEILIFNFFNSCKECSICVCVYMWHFIWGLLVLEMMLKIR